MRQILFAFMITAVALPMSLNAQRPEPAGPEQGTGQQAIAPADLPFRLGVAAIPDRATFEKLSYQGPLHMKVCHGVS